MTTYYVSPGVASTDVGAAISIGSPCNLNAAWDDMCAGTNIGDGDTIQLADGTYDNTTYDVPVGGLGDCSVNIDLTIAGASNDPALCIIDFSNNNANVDGFHITTIGTWTIKGLTVHGSDANSSEGEITFIDGTLNLYNCIIYNDRSRGKYGVSILSTAAAAACFLYNCELYDLADDGVSSNGAGGAVGERIIQAHFCYFHDIDIADYTQGFTPHDDGTARAYFCRFKNIGKGHGTGIGTGSGIGAGSGNSPIIADNCIFEDCYSGMIGTGTVTSRNCTFKNIDTSAIFQSESAEDVEVDSCLFWNVPSTVTSSPVINANGGGNVSIKRSALVTLLSGVGAAMISTLDAAYNAATSVANKSLTVEDCILVCRATKTYTLITTKYQTFNLRRSVLYGAANNAVVANFYFVDGGADVVMNIEHNVLSNSVANKPAIWTWGHSSSGANTSEITASTFGNTYSANAVAFWETKDGYIDADATDQTDTIKLRGFNKEIMLSPNANHYRDYGAPVMPGWYRPKGSQNMGAFCRSPIK